MKLHTLKTIKPSKEIIIVGNGSSLLKAQNGHEIDTFDTVVRFNSYRLVGYEKYVGSKADIWFTVNNVHQDEIDSYRQVYFHSWEPNKDKCDVYQSLLEVRGDIPKIEKSVIDEIPISAPSTGLIAIHYFLKEYDLVTITGFDWWARKKHHYGDQEIRGTLHNPQLEYDYILKLVATGRVRFLDSRMLSRLSVMIDKLKRYFLMWPLKIIRKLLSKL